MNTLTARLLILSLLIQLSAVSLTPSAQAGPLSTCRAIFQKISQPLTEWWMGNTDIDPLQVREELKASLKQIKPIQGRIKIEDFVEPQDRTQKIGLAVAVFARFFKLRANHWLFSDESLDEMLRKVRFKEGPLTARELSGTVQHFLKRLVAEQSPLKNPILRFLMMGLTNDEADRLQSETKNYRQLKRELVHLGVIEPGSSFDRVVEHLGQWRRNIKGTLLTPFSVAVTINLVLYQIGLPPVYLPKFNLTAIPSANEDFKESVQKNRGDQAFKILQDRVKKWKKWDFGLGLLRRTAIVGVISIYGYMHLGNWSEESRDFFTETHTEMENSTDPVSNPEFTTEFEVIVPEEGGALGN